MTCWTFLDYVSERGVNEIEVWQESLPTKAAARLEWVIAYLRGVKALTRPYSGTRANYPHVYELVVSSGGREFRPLYCYGPGEREVTLLIGAEEKGGKLEPRTAEGTAEERRQIILTNRERVATHE